MLLWSILGLALQVPLALAGISEMWAKFWNVSCEYSSPLSREKRSYFEEPNFNDPEELFEYLYPLAHLKPSNFQDESQRSAYPEPSLASWISDLIEFWQYECHLRHRTESDYEEGFDEGEDDFEEISIPESDSDTSTATTTAQMTLAGNGTLGNSSLLLGKSQGIREGKNSRVYGPNYRSAASDHTPGTGNRRMVSSTRHLPLESTRYGYAVDNNNPEEQSSGKRPRKKLRKRQRQSTTTTTTTPTPTAAAKLAVEAADKTDVFFSSYGGDIEYFFPLISFGIPFDGEITFLGFHGFKGLFPYR